MAILIFDTRTISHFSPLTSIGIHCPMHCEENHQKSLKEELSYNVTSITVNLFLFLTSYDFNGVLIVQFCLLVRCRFWQSNVELVTKIACFIITLKSKDLKNGKNMLNISECKPELTKQQSLFGFM